MTDVSEECGFGLSAAPVRGDPVLVRDARGAVHQRVALGGIEQPDKLLIVWTCTVDEWRAGTGDANRVPWPEEAVNVAFRLGEIPADFREDWISRLTTAARRPSRRREA